MKRLRKENQKLKQETQRQDREYLKQVKEEEQRGKKKLAELTDLFFRDHKAKIKKPREIHLPKLDISNSNIHSSRLNYQTMVESTSKTS